MVTKRGQGGRPSKGPRDAIMVRPHADLGALMREAADAEGLSISDYCTTVLAHELGRVDLAPTITSPRNQEVLPLVHTA